MVNFNQDEKT